MEYDEDGLQVLFSFVKFNFFEQDSAITYTPAKEQNDILYTIFLQLTGSEIEANQNILLKKYEIDFFLLCYFKSGKIASKI